MDIDSYLVFGTYLPDIYAERLMSLGSTIVDINKILLMKYNLELLELNVPVGTIDDTELQKHYYVHIPVDSGECNQLCYKYLKLDKIDDRIKKFGLFCDTVGLENIEPVLLSVPFIRM